MSHGAPPVPAHPRGPHHERRRVTRAPSDQLERLCRAALTVTGVTSCGVTVIADARSVTAHASAPGAVVNRRRRLAEEDA